MRKAIFMQSPDRYSSFIIYLLQPLCISSFARANFAYTLTQRFNQSCIERHTERERHVLLGGRSLNHAWSMFRVCFFLLHNLMNLIDWHHLSMRKNGINIHLSRKPTTTIYEIRFERMSLLLCNCNESGESFSVL